MPRELIGLALLYLSPFEVVCTRLLPQLILLLCFLFEEALHAESF